MTVYPPHACALTRFPIPRLFARVELPNGHVRCRPADTALCFGPFSHPSLGIQVHRMVPMAFKETCYSTEQHCQPTGAGLGDNRHRNRH